MVRGKSKQAVCMSNLGQMYKALLQYSIENDGYLPLESNSGSCSGEVWFKAVDRYITTDILPENQTEISTKEKLMLIKQDPVFSTVTQDKKDNTKTIKINTQLVQGSMCSRMIDSIRFPSKTVLLFDGRINNTTVASKYDGSYGSVAQGIQEAQIYFLWMVMSREYKMETATVLPMRDGQTGMLTRE